MCVSGVKVKSPSRLYNNPCLFLVVIKSQNLRPTDAVADHQVGERADQQLHILCERELGQVRCFLAPPHLFEPPKFEPPKCPPPPPPNRGVPQPQSDKQGKAKARETSDLY